MEIIKALELAQEFCQDCKHVFKIRYEPCFQEYTCEFYNVENEIKSIGFARGYNLAEIIIKAGNLTWKNQ